MLSFTLSGKQMTYTETHALLLIYKEHITVIYIKIFHQVIQQLIHIFVLIVNVLLFKSLTGHVLVLVSNVYVFRSPKRHIYMTYSYTFLGLIIIQISQRTYISDSYLYLSQTYNYSDLPKDIYLNFFHTDTYPDLS